MGNNPGSYPWNDLNTFFRKTFSGKIMKVLINTGTPCPHKVKRGGCSFCNEESIIPEDIRSVLSIREQIQKGIFHYKKRRNVKGYVAYFQRGTTTAAPVNIQRKWYEEAIAVPEVVALDIGTRPDYLPGEVCLLLDEMACHKPIFVDLGLQSAHEETLSSINRGHNLEVFVEGVRKLSEINNLYVTVHMILGLPGESVNDMIESFSFLSNLPVHGIKIHHLQIVKDTPLEAEYRKGSINVLSPEEFINVLASVLEVIPWSFVIHRLMGDQPKQYLVAPKWNMKKWELIKALKDEFKKRGTRQGSKFIMRERL